MGWFSKEGPNIVKMCDSCSSYLDDSDFVVESEGRLFHQECRAEEIIYRKGEKLRFINSYIDRKTNNRFFMDPEVWKGVSEKTEITSFDSNVDIADVESIAKAVLLDLEGIKEDRTVYTLKKLDVFSGGRFVARYLLTKVEEKPILSL